jgi:hypothetical protein
MLTTAASPVHQACSIEEHVQRHNGQLKLITPGYVTLRDFIR